MNTIELDVAGMSCEACVGHVTTALTGLDGVRKATVSLGEKSARVDYDATVVSAQQMIAAIEEEGYSASLK